MSWSWGARSLEHRAQLHPALQALADRVLARSPVDLAITDSHRDEAAQTAALITGATQLPWPQSKHNALPARAVHLDPLPIRYEDDRRYYRLAGIVDAAAHELGLTRYLRWGGDWDRDFDLLEETFKDLAHWELIGDLPDDWEPPPMSTPIVNFQALLGTTKPLRSLTMLGLVLFVAGEAALSEACELGLLADATCKSLTALVGKVSGVLVVLGIRRRLPTG